MSADDRPRAGRRDAGGDTVVYDVEDLLLVLVRLAAR